MKCSKIQDILLDYVYGELEAAQAVKVEEHVRACSECASALHDMEFTRKVFKTAESRVPTNGAVENIFRAASDALRKEEPAERKIIPLFSRESLRPLLVGAASVLLIIGVVMWIFRPPAAPTPAQPGDKMTVLLGTPSNGGSQIHQIGSEVPPVDKMFTDAEQLYAGKRYESAYVLYVTIYLSQPDYKHEYIKNRILDILDRNSDNPQAKEMARELRESNP
jgi:hypothetical protein